VELWITLFGHKIFFAEVRRTVFDGFPIYGLNINLAFFLFSCQKKRSMEIEPNLFVKNLWLCGIRTHAQTYRALWSAQHTPPHLNLNEVQ